MSNFKIHGNLVLPAPPSDANKHGALFSKRIER